MYSDFVKKMHVRWGRVGPAKSLRIADGERFHPCQQVVAIKRKDLRKEFASGYETGVPQFVLTYVQ
jgi:hypothetical protein